MAENKPLLIGVAAVGVVALIMVGLWAKYSDFLSRGMQAPESAKILNTIEKNGVPEFSLESVRGETISLQKFAGKIVIVNFWASWCEPCIREFPSMLSLIEKLGGEVVLLAISADYEKADMTNFLKAFDASSPSLHVAWDKDQEVAKKYGTFSLPESYILGRDGKLIRKISGIEEWDTPSAVEYFKRLVASK